MCNSVVPPSALVEATSRRASAPNLPMQGLQSVRVPEPSGAPRRRSMGCAIAGGFSRSRRVSIISGSSVLTIPSSSASGLSTRRGSASSEGSIESMGQSILSVATMAHRPSWLLPHTPDEYSDWCQANTGEFSHDSLMTALLASIGLPRAGTDRQSAITRMQQIQDDFTNCIPATPEARFCPDTAVCTSFGLGSPQVAQNMSDPATTAASLVDPTSGESRVVGGASAPSTDIASDTISETGSSSSTSAGSRKPVLLSLDALTASTSNGGDARSSVIISGPVCGAFGRQALRSRAQPFVPGMRPRPAGIPSSSQNESSLQESPVPPQDDDISQPTPTTTVMLKNLPQKFNREKLMEDLDARGFNGAYDFLYVPMDFKAKLSVGYAFINFVTKADCARFSDIYDGLKLAANSPKVCEVSGAKRQGQDCNVAFYRNSTVMGMSEEYHPVLLKDGVRKPFPKPTQPLGRIRKNCCGF